VYLDLLYRVGSLYNLKNFAAIDADLEKFSLTIE